MENNNHITDETDDTAEDTANNLNADGKLDWKMSRCYHRLCCLLFSFNTTTEP